MRWILVLALGTMVAVTGCGDDGNGTAGSGGSAGGSSGSGGSAGMAGSGGSGGTAGTGGMGGSMGEAPVITEIAWAPVGNCEAGVSSDWEITITATDADTDTAMLTYSGSAGCGGTITGVTSTTTCPNVNPYPGMATVMDPQGNSDTESFTYGGGGGSACMAGSMTFGP